VIVRTPIRLSDPQLQRIMQTASSRSRSAISSCSGSPPGRSCAGSRKPTDVDLERAMRAALRGLLQEPAA
jgi:hypothetical protein